MTLQEQRDVIQAAIDGKSLEYRRKLPDAEWFDIPSITTHHFAFHELEYRVKPEPREWFEVERVSGESIFAPANIILRYTSREEALRDVEKSEATLHVIKVREVCD